MMPRLVLATAPLTIEERYGRFRAAASTEPAFGLACLASAASDAGFPVSVVEASALGLTPDQASERVMALEPDVLGISATTMGIPAAAAMAQTVKRHRPDTLVVLGGCHVSAIPVDTLTEFPSFDIGVVGEGEATLKEILTVRSSAKPLAGIAGTVFRESGQVVMASHRTVIPNLDSLPLPAWSLIPGFPRMFRPSPARVRHWPCASLVFTRGCPNRCTFCDRSVFGSSCRAYSPERAVEIVRDLVTNYGVRELLMEDDTFIVSGTRIRNYCESLLAAGIKISWSCLGRADRVDPELLSLMKRAGCWHVSFGIESGDAGILRQVNKHLNTDQIRDAVVMCRDAGIRTKGFFMVGFPGETQETLETTRRFACSLPLDDITVTHLTPFPGSDLYKTAEKFGKFDRDWRKMNILDAVFVPDGLSREDLVSARNRILRDFYLRSRILAAKAVSLVRRPGLLLPMARSAVSLVTGK